MQISIVKIVVNISGISYSGLWIQNEIPPEEFASGMAFVGSTEIEISQGESFSIGQIN